MGKANVQVEHRTLNFELRLGLVGFAFILLPFRVSIFVRAANLGLLAHSDAVEQRRQTRGVGVREARRAGSSDDASLCPLETRHARGGPHEAMTFAFTRSQRWTVR